MVTLPWDLYEAVKTTREFYVPAGQLKVQNGFCNLLITVPAWIEAGNQVVRIGFGKRDLIKKLIDKS